LLANPEVEVELMLEDRYIDFVSDYIDVAIRNGRMHDNEIIARNPAPM
jgi:hypothetical protein